MKRPYIGVDCITNSNELTVLQNFTVPSGYDLLACVNVKPITRYENSTDLQALHDLLKTPCNFMKMITYRPSFFEYLDRQLEKLEQVFGEVCDGYVLHCKASPVSSALQVLGKKRIIVPIGIDILREVNYSPKKFTSWLQRNSNITDVLVDIRVDPGMEYLAVDTYKAYVFLSEVCMKLPHIGVGVTGGISANTLGSLQFLLQTFQLSIHTGQELCTGSVLDISHVEKYFEALTALL